MNRSALLHNRNQGAPRRHRAAGLNRVRQGLDGVNPNKLSIAQAFVLQDNLPRSWRELVYRHGQMKVFNMIQRGYGLGEAKELLERRLH